MRTGWIEVGGKDYYLGSNGAMKKRWQKDGDTWYCLNESSVAMAINQWKQ